MANAYVPTGLGVVRGIAAADTGVYLDSVSENYEDEIDEQLNHAGALVGFIHNFRPRRTVSVSGEIYSTTATDGLMVEVFGVAASLGGSYFHGDEFGITIDSGSNLFLTGATVDQGRESKKSVSMEFFSEEGFTGS
ncbi:hypothetical protein N9937_01750 [bacterium]|nr:hypothetical protein [bacterium]